jgi:hypothetical protein
MGQIMPGTRRRFAVPVVEAPTSLEDALDVALGDRGDGHERIAADVPRELRRVVDEQAVAPAQRVDCVGREHLPENMSSR